MDSYRKELAQTPEPAEETWGHWAADNVVPTVIRTVPAIGGGILGAAGGPIGVAAGGAAGAGLGSAAAQAYERWRGTRTEYSPGEIALDTGLGAIPFANASKGASTLARMGIHAAQGAGMAGASTVGESLINRGELPELSDVGRNMLTGGAVGGVIGGVTGRARGSVVEPPGTEIGPPRNPYFRAPWDRPARATVEPVGPINMGRAQPIPEPTPPPTAMGRGGGGGSSAPRGLPPGRQPALEATPGRSEFPQRGLPAAKSPYAALPDKELEGLVTFGDEEAWQELSKRGRVTPAGPSSLERKPIPMGPSSLPSEPEFPPSIRPLVDKLKKSVDKDAARPPRQLGARQEIAPIAPEQPMGIGPVEEPRPVGAGRSMGAAPPAPAPPGAGILTRAAGMQVPPRIGQPVPDMPAVPGRPMSGPRGPMPGLEPVGEVGQPHSPMAAPPPEPAPMARTAPARTPQTVPEYDAAITALEDRLYNTDVGDDMEGPLFTKLQRLKAERGELIDSSPLPDEGPPMADVYPPRAAIPGFDSPNFPAPTGPRAERMPSIKDVAPIPNPANIPGLEQAQEPPPLGARARRRAQRDSGAAGRLPFADRLRDERGMVDLTGKKGIPKQQGYIDDTPERYKRYEVYDENDKLIHKTYDSDEAQRIADVENGYVNDTGEVGPVRSATEPVGDVPPVEGEPTGKPGLGSKISDKLKQAQEAYKNSRLGSERGSVSLEGEGPTPGQVAKKYGRKAQWAVQDTGAWIGERLGEARTYKSGLDVSGTLRQGGHFKGRGFFWKTLPNAWKSLRSEEGAQETRDWIKSHPLFERAKQEGIFFSDETKLEDKVISKAAEKGFFPEGSKASEMYQGTVGAAYKRTNAYHENFLNELRLRAFEDMSKNAKPEEMEGLVKYINSATGRGSLKMKNMITGKEHDFEGAAETLNKTFFSARFAKSRLDLLPITNPSLYFTMKNPTVTLNAWRDLATNVGYVATANALAKAAGAEVTMDPRNPDFGKIKIGKSRLDLSNGMQPYIRVLSQLATGEKVSSVTGETTKLNTDKFGAPDMLETIERFGEGKLAPVPAFVTNLLRGKQITGEELDYTTPNPLKNEFARLFSPMIVDDMYDLATTDPKAFALMAPLALAGDSLQTYGEDRKSKTKSSGSTVAPRTIKRR